MNDRENGIISVSKSIFGNPRNGRRRTKQIMEVILGKECTTNHLYSYKLQPVTDPDLTETRPFPKCCKTCLPEADIGIIKDAKHLGLVDCFIPPTTSSYNSFMTRAFPLYSHYSRCLSSTRMHKLPSWQELEKDPDLLKFFRDEEKNNPSSKENAKKNVLKVLHQLQVTNVWNVFHSLFVRFSAWIFQKYLLINFDSVLVHGGEMEILKDVHSKKLPIIYIATYRSNFDKTLIMWTLTHHGFQTPLFVCGHKEKNNFLKYFGGIAATLKVESNVESQYTYSSAIAVYMKHLLKRGNSIILHVESKRSRSGRASPNVYGTEFLKIIYDEFNCNKIEDAYFVPVSVSYELLADGKEIFEGTKPNRIGIIGYVKEFLSGLVFPNPLKGRVKVDFGQPTSLRELHISMNKNPKIKFIAEGGEESFSRSRDCSLLRWNSNESVNSISSLYGELAPLYPSDDNEFKDACLLDVIDLHLLYDASKCESVMPTHLLAFILQKKFKKGVYLEQLLVEMQLLVKHFQTIKKDFGFYVTDCDMESIVFRAAQLLKDDINITWIEEKQTFKLEARQEIVNLRKLEYYANYLLPELMLEAVVATTIFALVGSALKTLRGFSKEVNIRDEEFIQHCRKVYGVVTGSFFLHEPCLSVESAIRKQVDKMRDDGLLTLIMRENRRYAWEDEDDDDDYGYVADPLDNYNANNCGDQDFAFIPESIKIVTTESTVDRLHFFRSLLMPYFEIFAYLITCLANVAEKEDKKMEMSELEKYLLAQLMEQSNGNLHHCRELCTKCIIKQFLETCEEHCILQSVSPKGTMDRFYEVKRSKIELERQVDDILYYVTC